MKTPPELYIRHGEFTAMFPDPREPERMIGAVRPYYMWGTQIALKSFADREKWQAGYPSFGEMRKEYHQRVLKFIRALRDPSVQDTSIHRIVILRLVKLPEDDYLRLYLVVKCSHDDVHEAHDLAEQSWHEILSTFPYEYALHPLGKEQLDRVLQQNISSEAKEPYIRILYPWTQTYIGPKENNQSDMLWLCSAWASSDSSMEMIWRTLYASTSPITLEVYLQPSILLKQERGFLSNLIDYLKKTSEQETGHAKVEAKLWHDFISQRIISLTQPYLMQVRLFSPDRIPFYIPRVVGTALSHADDTNNEINGYQVGKPGTSLEKIRDWREKIVDLDIINTHSSRLPYLVTSKEASGVFRLPYIPKDDLPDLKIEMLS